MTSELIPFIVEADQSTSPAGYKPRTAEDPINPAAWEVHLLSDAELDLPAADFVRLTREREPQYHALHGESCWRDAATGDLIVDEDTVTELNDALEQQTSLTFRVEQQWWFVAGWDTAP